MYTSRQTPHPVRRLAALLATACAGLLLALPAWAPATLAADPLITVIPISNPPHDVALDVPLKRAYLASSSSGGVTVVDTARLEVAATVRPPNYHDAAGVAADPISHRVYVADRGGTGGGNRAGTAWILDGLGLSVVSSYLFDPEPAYVTVSARLGRAYFSQWSGINGAAGIKMVDGASGAVLATNLVRGGGHVALDERRQLLYAGLHPTGQVDTFDATNLAYLRGTNFPGGEPWGIAADEAAGTFYVALQSADSLAMVDAYSGQELARVAVGDGPAGVALDPTRRRAYVANSKADTLSVVDLRTFTVLGTLAVGERPWAVAVDPIAHRVYVTEVGMQPALRVLDGLLLP